MEGPRYLIQGLPYRMLLPTGIFQKDAGGKSEERAVPQPVADGSHPLTAGRQL